MIGVLVSDSFDGDAVWCVVVAAVGDAIFEEVIDEIFVVEDVEAEEADDWDRGSCVGEGEEEDVKADGAASSASSFRVSLEGIVNDENGQDAFRYRLPMNRNFQPGLPSLH